MHRKTHVVTTTVLGGLMFAVPAFADNVQQTAHDTAQDVRSGAQQTGRTVRNTAQNTRDTARVQTARGGGETASREGADCPAGCVAVRHYTPDQVAAMRRARDERRDRLAREQAERDQMRQDLENCRTHSQQLEAQAQQLRTDAERDRLARAEQERAAEDAKRREADRLARYNSSVYYTRNPGYVIQRSRGGGPNSTHGVHLQFGLDGGVGGFTGAAHNIAYVGPTWGARVGVHFMNWFAIEGRYFGMWNDGFDANVQPNIGVVTNEGSGVLRLMIPTPYVRPYAFAGAGYAWNNRTWTNSANLQATSMRDNRSFVVPAGGGIDVPIGRRWGVGFEGSYHWYLDPNFTTQMGLNSGGQWQTGMNVHVAL
jgi:cell division septum initiation protein DivIVA